MTVRFSNIKRVAVLVVILLAGGLVARQACRIDPPVKPILRAAREAIHAPGWYEPQKQEYTPPVARIPLLTRRKPPLSRPLPIPETQVKRVIEIAPEAPSASGDQTPVMIVETKKGELIIPKELVNRVTVTEFEPRAVALEFAVGVGFRANPDRKEPVILFSFVNVRELARFPVTAGKSGPGVGVSVRVKGPLHLGAEYTQSWKLDAPQVSAVISLIF